MTQVQQDKSQEVGSASGGGFTPGPWTLPEEANKNLLDEAISISILDARGFPIAEAEAVPVLHDWAKKFPRMPHWADGANDGRTSFDRDPAEVLANARLIAAAPSLLAAARLMFAASEKACEGTAAPRWAGFENGNGEECGAAMDSALIALRAAIALALGSQA